MAGGPSQGKEGKNSRRNKKRKASKKAKQEIVVQKVVHHAPPSSKAAQAVRKMSPGMQKLLYSHIMWRTNPIEAFQHKIPCVGIPERDMIERSTHVFPFKRVFELVPDSDGNFSVAVLPSLVNTICSQNFNLTSSSASVALGGGRTFVPPGTNKAIDVRNDRTLGAQNVYFQPPAPASGTITLNSAAGNPGGAATFPCSLSTNAKGINGSIYMMPKRLTVPGDANDVFYYSVGLDTPFPYNATNISSFIVTVYLSATMTDGSTNALTIWAGLSSTPNVGTDTAIAIYTSTGPIASTASVVNCPANAACIYLTVTNSTSSNNLGLLTYNVNFVNNSGFGSSNLYGSGSTFTLSGPETIPVDFYDYWLIGLALLVQPSAALAARGGRIAIATQSTTTGDQTTSGGWNFDEIAALPGSYNGDFAGMKQCGAYGRWTPINYPDFVQPRIVQLAESSPVDRNAIYCAGNVPVATTAGLYSGSPITCTVIGLAQCSTNNLIYNPTCCSYLPDGMTGAQMDDLIGELTRPMPLAMENPSHEEWAQVWSTIKSGLANTTTTIMNGVESVGNALGVGLTIAKAIVKGGSMLLPFLL